MNTHAARLATGAVLSLALAADAGAQFRLGSEFRVNTTTAGAQVASGRSVGLDAAGNFVVAWASEDAVGYWDVYAQRFAANGKPRGSEFRVNTFTPGRQAGPRVGVDPFGNFVVAWSSVGQDLSSYGVFAQRFDTSGVRRGSEFRVNTFEFGTQYLTDVTADAAGRFAVVWLSENQEPGRGVYAQRYDFGGTPVGGEFRVNTYSTGDQQSGALAYDAQGGFVVAWASVGQDGGGYGIFGRRFDQTGAALGSEFRVNAYTTGDQHRPSVAVAPAGDFVVAWASAGQDGDGKGIFAQKFAATGSPTGGEFRVNLGTSGDQDYPAVGADPQGHFIVAWPSAWQPDDEWYGVYARAFTASGQATADLHINTYTLMFQTKPSIAVGPGGRFVVAWSSSDQDGSESGVYAQRMNAGIIPSALPVDQAAGVAGVEPLESSDEKDRPLEDKEY